MVVLMGKSSINGPFSMAMLNNQMVCMTPPQKIRRVELDSSSLALGPSFFWELPVTKMSA
jgi:hypothetical protein